MHCPSLEIDRSLGFLPTSLAKGHGGPPFVAIATSRDELCRWLGNSMGALQWLLAVGPLSDLDAWASSAYVSSQMPLDVVLSEPTSECSDPLQKYRVFMYSRGP